MELTINQTENIIKKFDLNIHEHLLYVKGCKSYLKDGIFRIYENNSLLYEFNIIHLVKHMIFNGGNYEIVFVKFVI